MGNNVTTTTVETVKINNDSEDNDETTWYNNKINGTARNDYSQFERNEIFENSNTQKPEWNYYNNQEFMG